MKVDTFIKDTFLKLTSMTCPYGLEDYVMEDVMENIAPDIKLEMDKHGNYFCKIGESKTVFTSHIDTVSRNNELVKHVFDGDIIRTDGNTILGADDKAGMTIMLWMMLHDIPGLYYFFIGEEVGCIGSGLVSKHDSLEKDYERMISFDRRGTNSIITFQSYSRSCSNEFADELCAEFNKNGLSYKKDDSGTHTDSAEFMDSIPECTNISVGYYKEHTNSEHQDIKHLIDLAKACILTKWEDLPTKRDPLVTDYKSYGSSYSGSSYGGCGTGWSNRWEDDDYDSMWRGFDDEYAKLKKNENKGTVYYDECGELVEIGNSTDYYMQKWDNENGVKFDWIIRKYADRKITADELETLKYCYFNMDDMIDEFFYNDLLSRLDGEDAE